MALLSNWMLIVKTNNHRGRRSLLCFRYLHKLYSISDSEGEDKAS